MLYESPNSPHRTVFTDGRDLPKDPNPTWLGTHFMSTATPTGFEFVKDAQGKVTHLMVRGAEGDEKAVRRRDE